MLLPITALYAALMVAILLWLGWGIGQIRGKTQISIGYGESKELAEAGRRYGNFTEHVPLALVLMAIVELNGGHGVFLHIVGALLVLCRIAHPLGLHQDNVSHPLRMIGAGGSLLLTVILGGTALWQGIKSL
ncbi:MAG: MAPEG family protein [Gammaproteobacteria bacterium]|nr:MAPEG family protein [Gammaproteobacteria bacterium]